jgi:pyruvate-formate lyase-activating enzyme
MHFSDILHVRGTPAAGIYMQITLRCPLSCAHCCTNSNYQSVEHPAELFEGFARSFTPEEHPEFVMLTGGEPLMRPRLVTSIARAAHAAGTKVMAGCGMFFAREERIAAPILEALDQLDHLSISMDEFHDAQVPQDRVFRAIDTILSRGISVNLQTAISPHETSYLDQLRRAIQMHFGHDLPILVVPLAALGRGKDIIQIGKKREASEPDLTPCRLATWPVVGPDGTIVTCCKQTVIDGPTPPHLVLGHAATSTYGDIKRALERRATLRTIRTLGPSALARALGQPVRSLCQTCIGLGDAPPDEVAAAATDLVAAKGFAGREALIHAILTPKSYALEGHDDLAMVRSQIGSRA